MFFIVHFKTYYRSIIKLNNRIWENYIDSRLFKLDTKPYFFHFSFEKSIHGWLFTIPKDYWADLAAYDPVDTARLLAIPMLILQGERAYQVTMTDFTRWNETFSNTPSVTLRTYPSLNHFFMAGAGVPNNTEYLIEGHVFEEVISDITAWISHQ